jgi:hypothetical protein
MHPHQAEHRLQLRLSSLMMSSISVNPRTNVKLAHMKRRRRGFDGPLEFGGSGVACILNHSHATDAGRNLLEQFEPFAAHRFFEISEPRDPPATGQRSQSRRSRSWRASRGVKATTPSGCCPLQSESDRVKIHYLPRRAYEGKPANLASFSEALRSGKYIGHRRDVPARASGAAYSLPPCRCNERTRSPTDARKPQAPGEQGAWGRNVQMRSETRKGVGNRSSPIVNAFAGDPFRLCKPYLVLGRPRRAGSIPELNGLTASCAVCAHCGACTRATYVAGDHNISWHQAVPAGDTVSNTRHIEIWRGPRSFATQSVVSSARGPVGRQ